MENSFNHINLRKELRGLAAFVLFGVLFAKHIPAANLFNSLKAPFSELAHEMKNPVLQRSPLGGPSSWTNPSEESSSYGAGKANAG